MKILIAYDGSDEAIEAIQALAWAGLPPQAEAIVVAPLEVWPPLPESCYGPPTRGDGRLLGMARSLARLARADALVTAREGAERMRQLLPGWSICCDVSLEWSAAGLMKKAREWGADCLFLGQRKIRADAPDRRNDSHGPGALFGRAKMA